MTTTTMLHLAAWLPGESVLAHHQWAHRGDHMGGWWFYGLFWVILIAALIGLAVWAIARSGGHDGSGDAERSAPQQSRSREVLDERYARGEISSEEYRERREGLQS